MTFYCPLCVSQGLQLKDAVTGVATLVWSVDGHVLVTGGRDGSVKVWNATGRTSPPVLVCDLPSAHVGVVAGCAVSTTDASLVVTVGRDGWCRGWSIPAASSSSSSSSSSMLAPRWEVSVPKAAALAASGTVDAVAAVELEELNCVAIAPDGSHAVVGTSTASVVTLSLQSAVYVVHRTAVSPCARVLHAAFFPTGRYLVCSSDNGVHLLKHEAQPRLDVDGGDQWRLSEALPMLRGHSYFVNQACFVDTSLVSGVNPKCPSTRRLDGMLRELLCGTLLFLLNIRGLWEARVCAACADVWVCGCAGVSVFTVRVACVSTMRIF